MIDGDQRAVIRDSEGDQKGGQKVDQEGDRMTARVPTRGSGRSLIQREHQEPALPQTKAIRRSSGGGQEATRRRIRAMHTLSQKKADESL